MLPEQKLQKDQHCIICATETSQQLQRTKEGAAWVCTSCDKTTKTYTLGEMKELVVNTLNSFSSKTQSDPPKVADTIRVYLKHHGPEADEKQASHASVIEHVTITRELPQIGKPLMTRPPGTTNPLLAVPFGEVTKVVQ